MSVVEQWTFVREKSGDLLSPSVQHALRVLFRNYMDSRLAVYRKLPDLDAARAELARSEELRHKIWSRAVAVALIGALALGTTVAHAADFSTSLGADALPTQPALTAERARGVPTGEEVNTGQDPTRPVTRVDVRFKYHESDHRAVDGDSVQVLTLRADWMVPLGGGWVLGLRGDLPLSWDDTPSLDNPRGVRQFGLSDALLQGFLITPTAGKWTAALGTQVIFPTAPKAQMGTGKFQLVPSAAVKYDLGGWIPRAWTALIVRHAVDVGQAQASRPSINQTIVQPFLNFDLPCEWFLTFSPEMRYDWQSADWHIPFNVEVGTMVTRRIVMSVEYNVAIEKNLPLYKQAVEFKVGYFF